VLAYRQSTSESERDRLYQSIEALQQQTHF